MTLPVPRRRWPERWRGWPREFWDPFGDVAQMWERMNRLFEPSAEAGPGSWVPMVETDEDDDAYVVRAELPGMKRDDVNVEISGNELRLTGDVKEEEEAGKTLRHRRGRFAYRTSLPAEADPDRVDAQLADGILTVRVPKAAEARSRRIEIKPG